MRDLFYTKKDNTTFWVSGYDCSSYNVDEKIDYLKENQKQLAKEIGCDLGEIKSYVIQESSCYKRMRVFYVENFKTNKAYQLKDDWTMQKWLTY